jgi:hypothetical protein
VEISSGSGVYISLNFTLDRPWNSKGQVQVYICLSLTTVVDGVEWLMPCVGPFILGEKDPLPIVQDARWAAGPGWTIAPTPRFDPRTVQKVAICCMDISVLSRDVNVTYLCVYIYIYIYTQSRSRIC